MNVKKSSLLRGGGRFNGDGVSHAGALRPLIEEEVEEAAAPSTLRDSTGP